MEERKEVNQEGRRRRRGMEEQKEEGDVGKEEEGRDEEKEGKKGEGSELVSLAAWLHESNRSIVHGQ